MRTYLICSLLLIACPQVALADKATESLREAPSHYCGLFCIYAVAQQRNIDIEFESLIDPALLTGRFGSSIEDIHRGFARCGVQSHSKAGLSLEHLEAATRPVLLHVASPMAGRTYRHWVLYLGRDDSGRYRIYDPPRDSGTLSGDELLSVWDGVAVLTEPPSVGSSAPPTFLLVTGLFVSVLGWGLRRKVGTIGVVTGLTLLVTMSLGFIPKSGILNSPVGVGSVQARFFPREFPVIDHRTMKERTGLGHILVDARPRKAFEYSHIPGAINLPVNSGILALSESARTLAGGPVILYCQSDGCEWADLVAQQLDGRGVKDIQIYRGGMNDWLARQR